VNRSMHSCTLRNESPNIQPCSHNMGGGKANAPAHHIADWEVRREVDPGRACGKEQRDVVQALTQRQKKGTGEVTQSERPHTGSMKGTALVVLKETAVTLQPKKSHQTYGTPRSLPPALAQNLCMTAMTAFWKPGQGA
jgi:hypothetical protein